MSYARFADPEQDASAILAPDEMGARMRALDWAASPLGSPETWPQSLRTVVSLLINSKFLMFVAWGPELAFLYNDGYAPILGAKHPAALGRRFEEIWFEIWDDISPLVERALKGEATFHENLPLTMLRKGFEEQTYFTFAYSPVRDESGGIGGMFCACTRPPARCLPRRRGARARSNCARSPTTCPPEWSSRSKRRETGASAASPSSRRPASA